MKFMTIHKALHSTDDIYSLCDSKKKKKAM